MQEDSLLDLIKSLSKSEKIHFKKWAAGFTHGRTPAYLQLFDELNQPQPKSESTLKSEMASGRSPAWFPTLKQYLYDRILESLQQYEKGKNGNDKAEGLKRQAELLIERKLYDQGLKRLRECRKLAYQLEHYALLLDALRLENHTLGIFKLHEGISRKKAINAEIKQLLYYLEQERFYFDIYDRLYTYSRQEPALRDAGEMKALSEELRQPALQDRQHPQSLRSKHLFYGIHTTYHTLLGNYEQSYLYSQEMLQIWEQYPVLRQLRFKEYLALFINHINRCYHLRKIPEFRHRLEEMRQLHAPNRAIRQLIDDRLVLFALSYHEISGDFQDFTATEQLAKSAMQRHIRSGNIVEHRLILYNLTYQLFLQEHFPAALEHSIAFDQLTPGNETQIYLQRSNKLLNLLLHFELGNFQYLENTWRSHHQQMEKAGQLYGFEALFIRMIREFTQASFNYRPKLDYERYLREFAVLKNDPFEKKTFEYLDITAWLTARQCARPILEILFRR